MQRACVLLLMTACGFQSPSAGVDGAAPDTAGSRCDVGETWESGKQPAKTVYVSTTPGPDTPDGSQANPFTTIGAAIPLIEPGTQILLGPGNYSSGATITDKRGTADAPIWIKGPAGGQLARLGGTGAGIHLIGAQYWVIQNLEIAGLTQQPGINVDDGSGPGSAHHIIIDRVRMGSLTRSCVQLSGVTDVVVRDSTLGSCDRGVMMVGVQRATIARMNIGAITTVGVAMAGGSADIEVRQNVIANVENGIGIWIGGDSSVDQFRPLLSAAGGNTEARDIRVFDNVIRDVKYAVQCSNCTSSLVAHNLIRRVSADVFRLQQPYMTRTTFAFARAGGVGFVNNAIEVTGSAEAMNDGGNGTEPASCTFSHDMWIKDGSAWVPTLPAAETMGVYGKPTGYSDDGRLCATAGNHAVRAGTPLAKVPGTMKGECRPSPPSIGPSEPDPGC